MELKSVNISNDGSAEIYYLDGDLFAGHSIVINLDSEGELGDADIAG